MELSKETPIFVKVDQYEEILSTINMIKTKINEAKTNIRKVNDIKNEEDSELEQWRSELSEIERKLSFVDKILYDNGQ